MSTTTSRDADREYLSVSEVALRLGVSGPTIRRRIAAGELRAVKLGPRTQLRRTGVPPGARRVAARQRRTGRRVTTRTRKGRKPKRGKPSARRVVLQRPQHVDDVGVRTTQSESGNWDHSVQPWVRGVRDPCRIHPVVRLSEDGVDWGSEPGPGDEVGYGMDPYRHDTCFQAAIATATQVPFEQVPDLALDRRLEAGEDPAEINRWAWERIERWATSRQLAMAFHFTVPVQRRRWIGVTVWNGDRSAAEFQDHCLVMSHDRVIFDPSCSVRLMPGQRLLRFDPSQISYGITFDSMEE